VPTATHERGAIIGIDPGVRSSYVFYVSDWLEMVWVDAPPHLAEMVELHAVGDGATRSEVHDAVGETRVGSVRHPVPIARQQAIPEPTPIVGDYILGFPLAIRSLAST
jgi:hypothetical protein